MPTLRRSARLHTPTGLVLCLVLGLAVRAVAQTELSDGRPIDTLRHESGTS